MGYGTNGLTFRTLRDANLKRLPQFRNALGEPAHSEPDGSDWSPAQWLQAVVGELGEYANVRKKFERGDVTRAEFEQLAADELADVQTYLDILAYRIGIDLGAATIDKWNRVSARVGSNVRIQADGADWYYRHAVLGEGGVVGDCTCGGGNFGVAYHAGGCPWAGKS